MTHRVAPPDQTVWWDLATVTAAVLARLRLKAGDPDEARITGLVDVAGEMINDHLDRRCPPGAATVGMVNALVALTAELYGRRDVPLMGATGTRIAQVDTAFDQSRLNEILSSLNPKKERFGVA